MGVIHLLLTKLQAGQEVSQGYPGQTGSPQACFKHSYELSQAYTPHTFKT